MEEPTRVVTMLAENWPLVTYCFAGLTAATAFLVQLLTIRKLILENEKLARALDSADRVIQVATLEQVERFAPAKKEERMEGKERHRAWAIDGAGLAAMAALVAATLPYLVYIVVAAAVLLVVAEVFRQRTHRIHVFLLATLRERIRADFQTP